MVVSFIHREKAEKQGKYEEYEKRRMERYLRTLSLQGYVNSIYVGEFRSGTVLITFLHRDLEVVNLPHSYC